MRNKPRAAPKFSRSRCALLVLVASAVGCASPLLSSYQHEKSVHCRVDNPDRDSLWDTSDENGNGVIDDNETVGPVFDFASLAGPLSGEDVSFLPSSSPLAQRPQPSQPAFREDFNNVPVNFGTPPGYLRGLRDYSANLNNAPSSADIDSGVAGISIASGGDGIIDNLDGDSLNGFFFLLVDTNNDGTGDTVVAEGADFDDLHTFNIAFDRVVVAPHSETHGMQISRTHRFTKKAEQADSPRNYFEFAYGARHLRLEESFFFGGAGSILGVTTIDMSYDNRLIGPQIGFNWQRQQGGWTLRGGSNLMLGYNFAKAHQRGILGESLAPGAINRPASARPNILTSAREHEELASIAELSAAASYQVLRNVAFQLGYRALYLSELRHAGESIDFSLPDLGILDQGDSNAWLEGLHASVEWRR